MDIIISDKWLREYLDTMATPKQIAEYVSLCGPSIEKLEEKDGDTLYHVEITTNRIDTVSVYGFAREVFAILPRFKIPVKMKPLPTSKDMKVADHLPFKIVGNEKLVKRTMGVVLTNIKNWKTPDWMAKRLTSCGVRSLNAVVDITNYIMLEVGHPSHAFDYDKIKNKKFVIRESKKGEKVTSFDGKTYDLPGGDIVFDDGDGEIIDLPGIIGTKNSVVDQTTKRVFFFVDNNDPVRIRNTSMKLSVRTMAASINEKGVDPELARTAILRGIELFKTICKADVASEIFDNYKNPYKEKTIETTKDFIDKSLGIIIKKSDIEKYLTSLNFKPLWNKDKLSVRIPTYRALDMGIPVDLIEEIARIYGYHNLPSVLMEGGLPDPFFKTPFSLEWKIKNILKALGGTEVYTLSLVPKSYVLEKTSLKLINPLGSDGEYLRTDLSHSLTDAVKSNSGNYDKLFLFEMANVYLSKVGDLPEEKMILGMCFDGFKYTDYKGMLETLVTNELRIPVVLEKVSNSSFLSIKSENTILGQITERDDGIVIVEMEVEKLCNLYKNYNKFYKIPNHPPQIEDLTIKIPEGVEIGKIINAIKSSDDYVSEIELRDIYNDSYTFRIYFQDPEKTLVDKEIAVVRNKIMSLLKTLF